MPRERHVAAVWDFCCVVKKTPCNNHVFKASITMPLIILVNVKTSVMFNSVLTVTPTCARSLPSKVWACLMLS